MGLINPKIITEFLGRKLDNHDHLKKLGPIELRIELYKEFKQLPDFDKLWQHQQVCFMLCTALKRFMLHIDMGGGKTLITLYSILYRKLMLGHKPKAIIFVPFITAVDTWIEECKKHTPQLKLVPLVGTTIENERLLEEGDGEVFGFSAQCEYVVWGSHGAMPQDWTAPTLPGFFEASAPKQREHITQKPLDVMRQLVRIVPPGGVILDPFIGSGTTGVAAVLEGRRFVGVEQVEHFAEVALTRIREASGQAVARGSQPALDFGEGA